MKTHNPEKFYYDDLNGSLFDTESNLHLQKLDGAIFGHSKYKPVDNFHFALALIDIHNVRNPKTQSLALFILFKDSLVNRLASEAPGKHLEDISSIKMIGIKFEEIICEVTINDVVYTWELN